MCPKCKGKSGYYTKDRLFIEQSYNWEGDSTGYTDNNCIRGKIRRCIDCGKVINNPALKG